MTPPRIPAPVRRVAAALRRPVDVAVSAAIVLWAAVQVALMGAPLLGVGLVAAGLYVGLRAGATWRQALREERDEANARVDRWNHGDTMYALDEVGSITPERRKVAEEEMPATTLVAATPPVSAIEAAPAAGLYRPDDEVPLCSWGPDAHPATTRIDIPGLRNAPACDEHKVAARLGEVTAADALPDEHAVSTYERRLG